MTARLVARTGAPLAPRGLNRSLLLGITLVTILGGAALSGSLTSTITISAAVTAVLAIFTTLAVPHSWARAGSFVRRSMMPFILFFLWAIAVTFLAGGVSRLGVQNLCVYAIFLGFMMIASERVRPGVAERFAELVTLVGWIVVVVYGFTLLTRGFDASGAILPRRSFPMEAIIIMAMVVPSHDHRWRVRALPYMLALEVAGSGSRTATIVACVFVALIALRGHGSLRKTLSMGLRLTLIAVAIFWTVNHISYIHERVFGGDQSSVLGITLNTEGRTQLWSAVIADAQRGDDWLGLGAGSTELALTADGFEPGPGGGPVEPHDDYLRVWHDFGWIGLALFVSALLLLTVRLTIARIRFQREIYLSGVLVLLGAITIMVTDNIVVYWYAMLPIGTIVGLALGTASADHTGVAFDSEIQDPS